MPNLQGGFIEPGQKISKQLTGCGAFTPFSALNASKTAMLAYEYAVSKNMVIYVGRAIMILL